MRWSCAISVLGLLGLCIGFTDNHLLRSSGVQSAFQCAVGNGVHGEAGLRIDASKVTLNPRFRSFVVQHFANAGICIPLCLAESRGVPGVLRGQGAGGADQRVQFRQRLLHRRALLAHGNGMYYACVVCTSLPGPGPGPCPCPCPCPCRNLFLLFRRNKSSSTFEPRTTRWSRTRPTCRTLWVQ